MTTVSNVSTNDLYLNVGQNENANTFVNSIHTVAGAHESNAEVQKTQEKKEINIDELLNDNKVLSQISGLPEDKAAESKAKIKECLEYALKDLKSRQATIDDKTLIKSAKMYYKSTQHGYKSVKDFYNQNKNNQESVQIRLIRFNYGRVIKINDLPRDIRGEFKQKYGNTVELSKLSKEEFDKIIDFNDKDSEKLNSYLESYFNEFLKGKEINTQKRDFYKLIYNTPDVDKEVLFKAIEYLDSSNRCPGFKALIESYTSEQLRTGAVDKCGVDFLKKMIEKDVHGNRISPKDMNEIVRVLSLYKSEKGAQEFHDEFAPMMKEFFAAHETDFQRIKEKQEKQEKLTPEEEELLVLKDLFYEPTAQGAMEGSLVNENLSKEFKTELLQNYAGDIKGLIIEDDVYNGIKSFIDNLAENDPNFSESDIQSLRDLIEQVSAGKYSELTGDICNSSVTETVTEASINTDDSYEQSSNSAIGLCSQQSSSETPVVGSLGFNNADEKPQQTVLLDNTDNNQQQFTVTPIITGLADCAGNSGFSLSNFSGSLKDFDDFCVKIGVSNLTKMNFCLNSTDKRFQAKGIKLFNETLNNTEQNNFLTGFGGFVKDLFGKLDDSQVVKLAQKDHLTNQNGTKFVKAEAEELEAKSKKLGKKPAFGLPQAIS